MSSLLAEQKAKISFCKSQIPQSQHDNALLVEHNERSEKELYQEAAAGGNISFYSVSRKQQPYRGTITEHNKLDEINFPDVHTAKKQEYLPAFCSEFENRQSGGEKDHSNISEESSKLYEVV
ncbi:hypothetical protein JTB14_022734 [Gonioctena quinquepunctata]|nr:hypothetical protein JTB14_022734 [Gonioctena quinquepunctata]